MGFVATFLKSKTLKKDKGGSRDTHTLQISTADRTGHTGTHRHTDHTDEPHNHPNPPTHPHDLATTESAAGSLKRASSPSTAAAQEPNAKVQYRYKTDVKEASKHRSLKY